MRVVVIGTGYVGLVTGVGLSVAGHTVTGIDVRPEVVSALNAGRPHIYEENLESELRRMLESQRIAFSVPDIDTIAAADIVLIAVGTPSTKEGIDLRQVKSAAELVGRALAVATTPTTVVVKSTVVPGTTRSVIPQVIQDTAGIGPDAYGLGMNPEFLREGSALADFSRPDRIVIGYENEQARAALQELYAPFETTKLEVNTATAELIKYANNLFLALQISATNEIADLAATLEDVDPLAVMGGVIADHRWSGAPRAGQSAPPIERYLVPGPGFGGSCFPKDVHAIREFGREQGIAMEVAAAVLSVNAAQPRISLARMLEGEGSLVGKRVAVLGLAFKPGTDDIRETPALEMVRSLHDQGAVVTVHDPLATAPFLAAYGSDPPDAVDDWRDGVRGADVVLVVTPWPEYRALPDTLTAPVLVLDPRRAFAPERFDPVVRYRSIGVRA